MNRPLTTRTRATTRINPVMWFFLIAFFIAATITAYLTFIVVRDTVKSWSATSLGGTGPMLANPTGTPNALGTPAPVNVPLQSSAGPTPQPWDGASRVNILVMGYDFGDWSEERKCPCRTDSMILLTIDPLTKSAGILNIPRDMWVNIPGFDYGKINTAYFLGDAYQLPGGGPGLAMETVSQFLGVPVTYYATIDFSAFETFIDEIGGVEVDVPAEIKVSRVGSHNSQVVIQPGLQTLDGRTALAYARARNSDGGDFDRAQRQQQVILAVREKILTLNMVPTLVSKAPIIYSELSAGLRTNMTLEQAIQLAWLAQQIPAENIKRGVISPPEQVEFGTSTDGLDILIPVPDKIRLLRDEIFTVSGPVSPVAAAGDPKELMGSEAARISVLNASSTTGLAARTQEFLVTQGLNVTEVGNAQESYSTTTIIDYSGRPYTLQYLIQVMELPNARVYSRYDPNSKVDIAILVGADWANNNTMP